MPDRTFVSPRQACCDSCGQEWFGLVGLNEARRHARNTGHQVRVEYLTRETLNERPEWVPVPKDIPQVELTEKQKARSREAAIDRLKADGVIA